MPHVVFPIGSRVTHAPSRQKCGVRHLTSDGLFYKLEGIKTKTIFTASAGEVEGPEWEPDTLESLFLDSPTEGAIKRASAVSFNAARSTIK